MKKYKISELAHIFSITRETLLYYNSIGILIPDYIDENNGYRYYSDNSVAKLGFILTLKDSNFSLKEIHSYLNSKDDNESLIFLSEKLLKIEEQIKQLNYSKKIIKKEIDEINLIISNASPEPFIEEQNATNIFQITVEEPKTEFELQKALTLLKKIKQNQKFNTTKRIATLPKEEFLDHNFFRINSIGYAFSRPNLFTTSLKGGTFACIFHIYETSLIGETYKKLINFIHDKKFKIRGDSIETFEDSIVVSGKKRGRIIKISIPIEK